MPPRDRSVHDLETTLRVGKAGIESVVDELHTQLDSRALVKVKFLRSARGGTDVDTLAPELAERVEADLVETRGHTAVFAR